MPLTGPEDSAFSSGKAYPGILTNPTYRIGGNIPSQREVKSPMPILPIACFVIAVIGLFLLGNSIWRQVVFAWIVIAVGWIASFGDNVRLGYGKTPEPAQKPDVEREEKLKEVREHFKVEGATLPGDPGGLEPPRKPPGKKIRRDIDFGGLHSESRTKVTVRTSGRIADEKFQWLNVARHEPKRAFADDRGIMRMVLSIALTGACLFVVLSGRYEPNAQHWAYSTLGTIVGFWMRGGR
jgi:hypothetical protein